MARCINSLFVIVVTKMIGLLHFLGLFSEILVELRLQLLRVSNDVPQLVQLLLVL